jgi:UDP-N-acetylmuramoyl-tripeptide--D-alanyl-D-alanine ligase
MEWKGNKIILDAYNANPTSMKAAIENFARIDAEQKMLFLGGMMELGAESVAEHQGIVDLIQSYQWSEVVLVGGDFAKINHPFRFFSNADEAANWFKQQQFSNAYMLIKGSRSMKMEKLIE